MEYGPDEEDMEDVKLDDERERDWRVVFEENYGRVDYKKALIHAKRWDVYVDEKENLIKVGYFVEVVGSDRRKVHWGVVDDHVVKEGNYHDEIGLRGLDFNLFD